MNIVSTIVLLLVIHSHFYLKQSYPKYILFKVKHFNSHARIRTLMLFKVESQVISGEAAQQKKSRHQKYSVNNLLTCTNMY